MSLRVPIHVPASEDHLRVKGHAPRDMHPGTRRDAQGHKSEIPNICEYGIMVYSTF